MPEQEHMQFLDYVVLVVYFVVLIVIGYMASRRIKKQEDFFMGGRGFGKLLQTFAAFGAGTGSSDPVNTARGVFVGGMSGMWSVMYWLFVTPFYWITGTWYRRMRHLTLGDWYVERYESKALGAGYAVFGIAFMMVYGSMLFSAIGKVAAPLIGSTTVMVAGAEVGLEYVLVPVIGIVVLVYGIAGGLHAAYYTDLIQGVCIILLSIVLIPFGLRQLVGESGELFNGFAIIHQQIPPSHFDIIGSSSSEFPWYRILAVVLINLVGIVVQPHFIATGGGSAKTEMNARVGLVVGNFLKRFCTIGWVLTALITLALFSDQASLVEDPDKVWGVATLKILGPLNMGLVGLMLACLLAALMSSVDAYMVVGSGLVVRNIYAAYINKKASDRECLIVGRVTGVVVVAGGVIISLYMMNVFNQLQLTWVFPVLFAAPFWVGMYWRRATPIAAWLTVLFNVAFFFVLPFVLPSLDEGSLRRNEVMTKISDIRQTTTTRPAAASDIQQRKAYLAERALRVEAHEAAVTEYNEAYSAAMSAEGEIPSASSRAALATALSNLDKAQAKLDKMPEKSELAEGDMMDDVDTFGGKAVFWRGKISVTDADGNPVKPEIVEDSEEVTEDAQGNKVVTVTKRYQEGEGITREADANAPLRIDLLLFHYLGVDLQSKSDALLDTLELPAKIVLPFVVMILLSFITPANSREALDRYYSKMKTPVDPHPDRDQENLRLAYENRQDLERRKLFPNSNLEFQRPSALDIIGVVVSFLVCFAVIWMAFWVAQLGT